MAAVEPVVKERAEQFGPLVHECMACLVDDREGGVRISIQQADSAGIAGPPISSGWQAATPRAR